MPLPPPTDRQRQHIHSRDVSCRGYRRSDGLWDIEGHLTDIKTYPFDSEHRGHIEPGDPVHGMWIRLTVDNNFTVKAIEAVIDKAPFGPCSDIVGKFQSLVGLSIGAGWTRAIRERLDGVNGCKHLSELLGPIATTAFQTIYPILFRERADKAKARGDTGGSKERPALLDACHIFATDGVVVHKYWPDHYTGPLPVERTAVGSDPVDTGT
jgi:hypothetical protein